MGQHQDIYSQTWFDESALLGEKLSEFHWRNLIPFQLVLFSGGLCCSILSVSNSIYFFPICLMSMVITVAIGNWLFHIRVSLYEGGFKYRSLGNSQLCLWGNIVQLYDHTDKNGQPTYLNIMHRNGSQITVPDNVRAFSILAQTIIDQFTAVNLPDSLNVLNNRGMLYFGSIVLTKDYFEVNARRLPLARVESVHLEQFGRIQLHVWTPEDRLRWLALSEMPVPNRHLLKKLVLERKADIETAVASDEASSSDPETGDEETEIDTIE